MDIAFLLVSAGLGSFIGYGIAAQKSRKMLEEKGSLLAICREKEIRVSDLQEKLDSLNEDLLFLTSQNASLQSKLAHQEKETVQQQEKFKAEFENLATRLFKEHSKEFAENSQEKIENILSPLKHKIDLFQTGVQEISKAGTAERLSLKYSIEKIAETNKVLSDETHRLSRVLKGDVKKQGTWGELVLQKVLEASGLRENIEYTLQAVGLSLSHGDGGRLQPDVILNLPDSKKIIIDSKMSYTHYDDYLNTENEQERKQSLNKLVSSVKDHIKGLSEKNYSFAQNLESPHFVLLFVPVEAIFSLVVEAEPSLFEEAWKRSIILVSPTNLLAILRTIESVWKVERQNRNTHKIAEEAALLYDKFVDLLKDLEVLGKYLKNGSDVFEKTISKISSGRGNLIKKTEDLKKLGLKTKKQIPAEYLEEEVLELTSES